MNWIAFYGITMSLLVAPGITFLFIWALKRSKASVELARLRKETLELELRKEELHLRAIEAESRQYDRLLESRIQDGGPG